MRELSLILAWSMEASVRPRSLKTFLSEVLSDSPGELLNVKHISMGSSLRFLIYCALFFSLLS
jgi:hypothetical protein